MIHPSAGHVTRLGSPCTPMTKLYRSCTRLDGHVTSSTRCNCTALSFRGPTLRGLSRCQTPKERVHAQTYDSISSLLRTRSSIVSIYKAHRAPAQPRNESVFRDVETPQYGQFLELYLGLHTFKEPKLGILVLESLQRVETFWAL